MGVLGENSSKRALTGVKVVLATQNAGKVVEFGQLLAGLGVEVVGAKELGLEQPHELTVAEGGTFVGNSKIKAEFVSAKTGLMALADDSGIAVDALEGAPGVDTAHFGGWEKLLEAMAGVPEGQRRAKFVCVLSLARPGKETLTFEGVCEGRVSAAGKGDGGFGYDPVFIPENEKMTFAEMGTAGKARFSHRARAVAALLAWWEAENA